MTLTICNIERIATVRGIVTSMVVSFSWIWYDNKILNISLKMIFLSEELLPNE